MDSQQEIYGLCYDFVYRHGLVMKLHRSEGIYAQELSEIQLRMLESNTIPRLLPVEVQEIDFQISLLYQMHSKRMLSQVLKTDGLTKAQLIKLMFAIVSAVDQSGNYMLNESQYLLLENFIFIGGEITDVHLTYLPFQQLVGEIPLHSQIRMLTGRLIENVKQEEREGLDNLLNACTEEFKLSAFKQMLLEWMGKPMPPIQAQIQTPTFAPQETLKHIDKPFISQLPKPIFQNDSGQEQRQFNEPSFNVAINTPEKDYPLLLTKRNRLLFLAASMLALAFIWKSYLDHPHEAFLNIASGTSLLLIDLWFVLSFIGRLRIFSWIKLVHVKHTKTPSQQDMQPKLHASIQDHYENLHTHTTLLSAAPSHATVFLGSSHLSGMPQLVNRSAMIEVNKAGTKKQIPMIGNSFTIGRGETECSYVEPEAGLSRLHAEIFKALEGYGVKDLGSKNGTLLNDEPLVPYQSYPIKDGDVIRILKTEFRIL